LARVVLGNLQQVTDGIDADVFAVNRSQLKKVWMDRLLEPEAVHTGTGILSGTRTEKFPDSLKGSKTLTHPILPQQKQRVGDPTLYQTAKKDY